MQVPMEEDASGAEDLSEEEEGGGMHLESYGAPQQQQMVYI